MKNYYRVIRKAMKLAREPYYRKALRQGVGAAIEHEPMLRTLAPYGIRTVLDVGANIGQFTLVARHVFPNSRVIAFEPLAAECERFASVHAGDSKVKLVRAALGPERATVAMHVAGARDSSSLLPITATQAQLFPGTGETHCESVQVLPLLEAVRDEELAGPLLLKIDVQGFELQVLEACAPVLDRVEFVYVECSFVELYAGQAMAGEVAAWLHQRRFTLIAISSLTHGPSGVGVQADFLYRRSPGRTAEAA
jgi:FkbM family methyltransferase